MSNVERIRSYLDEPELLCQLAEECAELAKAAMKVRRVQEIKDYKTRRWCGRLEAR